MSPTTIDHSPTAPRDRYDVVIVGARIAGPAAAMLLARRGLDVLVIDKAAPGSDTLSSHALMRGAVAQLDRWGLTDRVARTTPVIRRTTFRYDTKQTTVEIAPEGGAEGLFAPRRTVLDPIMVDAARDAGATVLHHTSLVDVSRDRSGRVTGATVEGPTGIGSITADLVVGADGLRSSVARHLDVPVIRSGQHATASVMKYIAGTDLPDDEYLWLNQPGLLGGVIPTNDDLRLVFISMPPSRFQRVRGDLERSYWEMLHRLSPDVATRTAAGAQVGPMRSWPGHVGQFRQASGPGWALLGDAGYFKDPGAAHGISDAFRDAELLTDAFVADDLPSYGTRRDAFSAELFEALEKVIDMTWTLDELPGRQMAMSKAMSREHKALQAHWNTRPAAMASVGPLLFPGSVRPTAV